MSLFIFSFKKIKFFVIHFFLYICKKNKTENIMKEENKNIITFRNATLEKLMDVVDIKQIINDAKFKEWFSYKYEINTDESGFLKELIDINKIFLPTYNEQNLLVKFIGLIINKIKFHTENIKEWFGYQLSCELNGYILKGEPDLMLASGFTVPAKSMFLQEQ